MVSLSSPSPPDAPATASRSPSRSHLMDAVFSYDGNVMLAAIVCLLLVILFVLLLHFYARCFLSSSSFPLPGCGHGFHVDCIDTWLRSRASCPICREPVVADARRETENKNKLAVAAEDADPAGAAQESRDATVQEETGSGSTEVAIDIAHDVVVDPDAATGDDPRGFAEENAEQEQSRKQDSSVVSIVQRTGIKRFMLTSHSEKKDVTIPPIRPRFLARLLSRPDPTVVTCSFGFDLVVRGKPRFRREVG